MSKKLVNIINIFFIVLLLIQNTNQLKKPMITEGNRLFSKMSPFGEGGNTMSGLNIETTNDSKSGIILGTPNDFFSFVIAGNTNNLELNHNEENILIFNKNNEIEIFPKIITLNNGMDFSGNLKIRGVNQWKLFKEEDFSYEAKGWSNNTVSSCAGINMMGGYCKFASGETWKLFENIPPHKQIKIEELTNADLTKMESLKSIRLHLEITSSILPLITIRFSLPSLRSTLPYLRE